MGRLLPGEYSALPFRGVIPIPPAKNTAGRSSSRTKSPKGPCRRTVSPGRREAKARLKGDSDVRTAYSRFGRVGELASDIGRACQPSSVLMARKVNWTGRKENPAGFFTAIP